jgi:hypothetical protein
MYAEDHPGEWRFLRGGDTAPTKAELNAAWERVLIGRAKLERFGRMMPSLAVLRRAQELTKVADRFTAMAAKK